MAEGATFQRKRFSAPYMLVTVDCETASDDGALAANNTTPFEIHGVLISCKSVPDGGGTAPTDQYDLVLNDESGVDLLAGAGADRSGTAAEIVTPAFDGAPYAMISGPLTVGLTNAGNSKGTTLHLWFQTFDMAQSDAAALAGE